jgi:2-haloacid dehalogenase
VSRPTGRDRRRLAPHVPAVVVGARRAGAWRDLDALHGESVVTVLSGHDLALPAAEHEALVASWRRLPAWPDVRPGKALLRRHVTATLSNGHVPLLIHLVRFADLRFDAVLSAQSAGSGADDRAQSMSARLGRGRGPPTALLTAGHPV